VRRRRVATDAAKTPRFDVFLALASLAARFDRPWIIVTQRKLLERVRATTGRALSRRTLNRHLAGLERDRVINRLRRHRRGRYGDLELRATLYTFGQFGILWIKRLRGAASIPLGRRAVPDSALSGNRLSSGWSPVHESRTGSRRPGGRQSNAPKGAPRSAPRRPRRRSA